MPARLRVLGLLVLLLLVPVGEAAAQRVALVVGASAYRHVPALPNAANDATDMAESLRALGFRVDLVLDPDRAALERAVERFGQSARGAEAALFYYAGHAIEVGGRNWLIPVSAELRTPQQLRFQALELDAVTEQTQAAARVSLIILDACRDDPFRQRWPAASRGVAGRGLVRVSPATGTLVVFSTAPGAVAEDGTGRNSPFTAALLEHMPTPGLEVRPMLAEVRRTVREATRGGQIPWEESSLEGSFYFNPAPAPAPAPVAPPAPLATPALDALAWQFVLNSRNPADFEAFLAQFPDSVFAPFARNRLAELQPPPPDAPQVAPLAVPPPAPQPRIAALPVPPPPAAPPDPLRALTRAEAQEMQRLLSAMGLDTGGTSGVVGPRTREALGAFALAIGLPETLEPTAETLERLRAAPPPERRATALVTLGRRALEGGDAPGAARLAAASQRLAPGEEARLLAAEAARAIAEAEVARAPAPVALAPAPRPAPPAAAQPSSLPIPRPSPEGPIAFRCPSAGLVVIYAGFEQAHRGADPRDPEVCLVGAAGQPERLLFGIFPLPIAGEEALRAGLRPVWPAVPGGTVSFMSTSRAPSGASAHFRETWRVTGRETVEVGGVPRLALVIERRRDGMFQNDAANVETYWQDIETGAWLRRQVSALRGLPPSQPFAARRIEMRP